MDVHIVRVFPNGPGGGNPAPIILDADDLTAEQMRRVAAHYGHESGFVLLPRQGGDLRMQYFVPNQEMEMCGHATIGALWTLRRLGRLIESKMRIETQSGIVSARVPASGPISISQPSGKVQPVDPSMQEIIFAALGVGSEHASGRILNARTSRTKTLVEIVSVNALNKLSPTPFAVKTACESINSTGLYPFAVAEERGVVHARQFPRNSGYPEDAATGIAAAALAFGMLELGLTEPNAEIEVRQGEAMGKPSSISVFLEGVQTPCWIAGECANDSSEALYLEDIRFA